MTASKNSFPFPMHLGALDWFCHPAAGHALARPVWVAGEVWVGNGYLALRCGRGLWHSSDFEPAVVAVRERFEKLPWGRFVGIRDEWRALDDIRGTLYRHAPVYPWTDKGRSAPSPVWWVNGDFLARLSHLQLIARLPRCEVHLGGMTPGAPLLFRFNGGIGMLVADAKLSHGSFSVFDPRRHEDGSRLGKRKGPCVLPPQKPNWPDFEKI